MGFKKSRNFGLQLVRTLSQLTVRAIWLVAVLAIQDVMLEFFDSREEFRDSRIRVALVMSASAVFLTGAFVAMGLVEPE